MSALIATYGYLAVFAGTFLEGETLLLAAGYAAHRGLLDWRIVWLVASLGATLGDQCAYLLGRWRGAAVMARFPRIAAREDRLRSLLHRYGGWCVVLVRFLYGLRIAGPICIGMVGMQTSRFVCYNLVGAIFWAALVIGAGWMFGLTLSLAFERAEHLEAWVLGALIVGASAYGVTQWWRERRRDRG